MTKTCIPSCTRRTRTLLVCIDLLFTIVAAISGPGRVLKNDSCDALAAVIPLEL